jgi:hypothetical protein
MSDTTKHTPALPLRAVEGNSMHQKGEYSIYDANDRALTGWGHVTMTKAEAEFLTNRANSHQALVDALQMAKHIVANYGNEVQLAQVFNALEDAGVKP